MECLKSTHDSTVVALTEVTDEHLPLVQCHLDNPIVVADATSIANGSELSHEFSGGKLSVVHTQDLKNVTGVWYRRPKLLDSDIAADHPHLKAYALDAFWQNYEELYAQFPDALWMSEYHRIQAAESKTRQLKVATDLGLRVPDTLITSNQTAARHFVAQHPAVVVKSLARVNMQDKNGEPRVFLTQRVDSNFNFESLQVAPLIFQEAIEVGVELRVTVVGEQAFAAAIHSSDEHPIIRDYRFAQLNGRVAMEAFELPEDISRACVAHSQRLGLNYGAIDLIVDPRGEIWFLENNPSGQWGFVEEATGQPIGKAVAQLLSTPGHS